MRYEHGIVSISLECYAHLVLLGCFCYRECKSLASYNLTELYL